MAITRKTKVAPAAVVQAPVSAPDTFYVRLTNGCSTYVTPEREVFYARDPQSLKTRVYAINGQDAVKRLLGYKDDYGRRFFRQVPAPEEPDDAAEAVLLSQIGKADPKVLKQKGEDDDSDAIDNDGEIDTGAVRLRDADGEPVGVVV